MELLNIKSARHFHNYFIDYTDEEKSIIRHIWLSTMPIQLIIWLGGATTPTFSELWK